MVSSRPSAVDSAAARPPAATRPDTTYGRPAISGVASTMMSPPITISASCTMPSKLRSVIVSSVGSTSRQAAAHAGSSANCAAHQVRVDVVLGEHREAGRGEVQQEDEEQRPEHRLARLPHAGRGVVAHQDVRQRRGAEHHAEHDAEEVAPRDVARCLGLARERLGVVARRRRARGKSLVLVPLRLGGIDVLGIGRSAFSAAATWSAGALAALRSATFFSRRGLSSA